MVVGLLADPDLPSDLAGHLVDALPDALADATGGRAWRVEARKEVLVGGEQEDATAVLEEAGHWLRRQQWDAVIALTDLPRRSGTRAVVADLLPERRAALASVPALGAVRLRRRTLAVTTRLVLELVGPTDWSAAHGLRGLERTSGEKTYRLVLPARLGGWRLLIGMVRANRPWRLVSGLSGALLAAFAASAFCLFSNTLWELADQLGAARLALAAAVSIGSMVVYLVMQHGLWEQPLEQDRRRLARLYNVSTAATLALGVLAFHIALSALMCVLTPFFLTDGALTEALRHPPDWTDYLAIAWLSTSIATVSGALGSGTEDEESVRRAAYGHRHRARLENIAAGSDPGTVLRQDG